MDAKERAEWAKKQREHMLACGAAPQPEPHDPSPLVTPETYALWCSPVLGSPKALDKKTVERELARLAEKCNGR